MKRWAVVGTVMLVGCASMLDTMSVGGLAGTWRAADGREIVIAPLDAHDPDDSCWKEKGATIRYGSCMKEGVPVYRITTFASPERMCNVTKRHDVLVLKDCDEAGEYARVKPR